MLFPSIDKNKLNPNPATTPATVYIGISIFAFASSNNICGIFFFYTSPFYEDIIYKNILNENDINILQNEINSIKIKYDNLEKGLSGIINIYNNLINTLAWWIPIRKWRDNFRNKFFDNFIGGGGK